MSETENLRSIMKTMEMDFKQIEERIRVLKTNMDKMRETIKQLEKKESIPGIRVTFGNGTKPKKEEKVT